MKFIMTFLAAIIFSIILIFFSLEEFLPHKRKMEKMLDTIRAYQRKHDCDDGVEISYKGKRFRVSVIYTSVNFYYNQYIVWINGNLVKTFHILEHLFSKSRQEEHHGDMREYEEFEIIEAAYKFIKKENKKSFNDSWDKSSYFD